jgi:simple sugar transport system permease protein
MTRKRLIEIFNYLLSPILAVVLGFLMGSAIILATGDSPLMVYREMMNAAFGSQLAIANTLQWATPILLTGLSAVMAFRSGAFSIGMQGQFLFGGLVAGWLGAWITLPDLLHQIVICVLAMIAGALWALLPGVLKVKWEINEIITTIVMNFIAVLIFGYLIGGPLRDTTEIRTTFTPVINEGVKLPPIVAGSRLSIGFIIAFGMIFLVQIYMWRTTLGYEQRMTQSGFQFARAIGINVSSAMMRGFLLSGAISGLAGAIEVLGVNYRLMAGFGSTLAFDGVMVAILGQAMPLGVFITSILFAGLRQGALALAWTTNTPRQLGGSIIAMIVLFMAIRGVILHAVDRYQARRKDLSAASLDKALEGEHA